MDYAVEIILVRHASPAGSPSTKLEFLNPLAGASIVRMSPALLSAASAIVLSAALAAQTAAPAVNWPGGKRVAVSFSFDDARASQMDAGVPLFDRYGAKVTFYVNPRNMDTRPEAWKSAASKGYEIGNHSGQHPCTGNFPWSRTRSLEEYTLTKMAADLDSASEEIARRVGVKPVTFAYPCGQKYVGRGLDNKSYVPVVAERFLAGRGFRDEVANDPSYCDLAQVMGIDSDAMTFEQMRAIVEDARQRGAWVVFAGHDIGAPGRQVTEAAQLERFLKYAQSPDSGIWLDTIANVARHIQSKRPR